MEQGITRQVGSLRAKVGLGASAVGVLALALLVWSAPARAQIGSPADYLFDPVLSLEGNCSGTDGHADPGCPYLPPPEGPKALAGPCGAATDPHGDVYVAVPASESTDGRIDVFDPKGKFLVEISDENQPCQIAVDSSGNLYVVQGKDLGLGTTRVVRYEPKNAYPPIHETTKYTIGATIEFKRENGSDGCEKTPTALAIDPSNDHLYVGHACKIEEYGSAAEGTPANPLKKCCIGKGPDMFDLKTIGVYGRNHDVYATRRGNEPEKTLARVFIFDGTDGHIKCELNGSETPAGKFDFGIGGAIGIEQEDGELYVYDLRHGVIDQFVDEGGECPKYAGQLPEPSKPPVLTEGRTSLAVDAPCRTGTELQESCSIGKYESPNVGEVYLTTGTNGSNSHLYAFKRKVGGPPEVEQQSVSGLDETDAVLAAKVNPNTFATVYHFEYTTQADFEANGYLGAASAPVPKASAGEGGDFVQVAVPVTGLQPDTAYRFRLVAANHCGPEEAAEPEVPKELAECRTEGEGVPGGEGEDASFATYPVPALPSEPCPNAVLRNGASETLPDCRAYELVTPPDTNGRIPTMAMLGQSPSSIGFDTTLASPDGGSVVFGSNSGSIPDLGGGGERDTYEALRDEEAGWQSRFTSLSAPQASRPRIGGFSSDHGYSFWDVVGDEGSLANPVPSPVGGEATYLQVPPGVTPSPNCAAEAEPEGRFEWLGCGSLGFEPRARGHWIGPGGAHVIFDTLGFVGTPIKQQLESCAPPTGTGAIYDRTPGGPTRCVSLLPGDVTPAKGEDASFLGASADGRAVGFSIGGSLYVRVDNAETFEIAGGGGAELGGIAADGSRAFYVKGGNVFACDLEAGGCAGEGAHAPIEIGQGGKSTLVNVSADGSHAYFVSKVALSGEEENEAGEKAKVGNENLYVWDGTTARFIAILEPLDVSGEKGFGGLGLWVGHATNTTFGIGTGPADDPSRTTPDGSVLVFESHADLTGYDSGGRREVYRFEADAAPGKRLSCLSCNPTGADAVSDAQLETKLPGLDSNPFSPVNSLSHIDNVSADGQEVFFQSADRLVAADNDSLTDVYEWEAQGTGGCKREAGCLSPISSGRSAEDNFLYAMTPDGHDVFFLSADTLVPQDPSGEPSIYDARVDGGFPSPTPPNPECLGEACQPSLVAPEDPHHVPSLQGNPTRHCPKGKRKVRKEGKTRCLQSHGKKERHGHSHRHRGKGR